MASYQSGFDPPTRPGDLPRNKRMGAYTQQGPSRPERREADIAHISGQVESRGGQIASRPQHTGLPRPSMRDPSPSTRSVPETKSRNAFIFGKTTGKPTAGTIPELRGKSSRNVLRRKPSSVAWQQAGGPHNTERSGSSSPTKWSQTPAESRPSIESALKSAEAYNEIFTRQGAKSSGVRETPRIIPELDRYRTRQEPTAGRSQGFITDVPKLATQDLPPPTPQSSATSGHSAMSYNPHRYSGSGYSASPSTRFSESPGPGAYSRDTTPTSMSSQSPGIVAPLKTTTPRIRQGSPASSRPPVTRRRAGSTPNEVDEALVDASGLPALRESITSSSSNSTVRGDGKTKEKKKKRLSPLPPSPPPRKSSQKFKKSPPEGQKKLPDDHRSPSKASQAPARPVMLASPESSPVRTLNPPNAQSKTIPPTRPSRDGTPNLQSQIIDPMTIIQSNLSGLHLSRERRQSLLPRGTSPTPLQPPKFQTSKTSSRNPSPSPIQPSQREGTPAPSGLGIIPDLRPQEVHPSARPTTTRTPSPSVATAKSRFGLFGRRTKTAPGDIPNAESKGARKGPAAGTGHEGYGRYGPRVRSISAGGLGRGRERSMSGASSSQESVSGARAHDPFLLERMSPVIIAGGGEIIENRNASSELTRTESDTSLLLDRPSMDSKASSKTNEVSRATLWPSALPRETAKRASTLAIPKGRRPSDSSDDGMGQPSSLAFRRSIQRYNNSAGVLNLPKPINIPGMGMSPSVKSLESSIMSDESQLEPRNEVERGRKGQLTKPKKLEKRPKSPRKWNFFHRSQNKDSAEPRIEVALPVTVGRPPVKAVPHYALLDSSDEQQDAGEMDLEDILRDADVIDLSDGELDALQFGEHKENLRRIEQLNTMMKTPIPEPLPERPPIIFSSPDPLPITPELLKAEVIVPKAIIAPPVDLHLTREVAPSRPSRLPQVGRIPKVVSARPVATSPKSFSRPFARLSTIQPLAEPVALDKESVGLGPSPPKPSTPEPMQPNATLQGPTFPQESADSKSESTTSHKDFLAFSPRKNSEGTTSSSGGLSFAGTTAIIPEADAALEEDEVWGEYDDLIESDPTHKIPASATSSVGVPFQYESYETRGLRQSRAQAKEITLSSTVRDPSSPTRRSALTNSSTYSADMTARMKDAFTIVPSPTTPLSFTDFFSGYGDRNNFTPGDSARKPERRRSSQNSNSSHKSQQSNHTRSGSGLMTITEQDNSSPISQVNLRVGSMTVSKWLTFGHVLFSPAREDLQGEGTKRCSVLIIDGLGNDDWSFYAAETYPSATFYNLSPTRPLSASQQPSGGAASFPLTPPNHRQIQYPSPSHKFPFPSSTFHVVVFRFPPALPETSYRNIISESRRVLKPGGYLELSLLDLDMLNMGNRARRAVRKLKMDIQGQDPTISLGSASDTVLRLVGKRGFVDVKSCNVGVPVASAIPSASGSPGKKEKEEMSLADMMRDESQASDEGITKMVAKVGRWWYTRCYESAAGDPSTSSGSIFNDETLLGECEKWNASFKLVVAYAQKPVQGRRRTNSV